MRVGWGFEFACVAINDVLLCGVKGREWNEDGDHREILIRLL